jgi:hypothetical protein
MIEKLKRLLLAKEAIAEALGDISISSVNKLLSDGSIEKVRIGARTFGTAESVERVAKEGVKKITPKWRTTKSDKAEKLPVKKRSGATKVSAADQRLI